MFKMLTTFHVRIVFVQIHDITRRQPIHSVKCSMAITCVQTSSCMSMIVTSSDSIVCSDSSCSNAVVQHSNSVFCESCCCSASALASVYLYCQSDASCIDEQFQDSQAGYKGQCTITSTLIVSPSFFGTLATTTAAPVANAPIRLLSAMPLYSSISSALPTVMATAPPSDWPSGTASVVPWATQCFDSDDWCWINNKSAVKTCRDVAFNVTQHLERAGSGINTLPVTTLHGTPITMRRKIANWRPKILTLVARFVTYHGWCLGPMLSPVPLCVARSICKHHHCPPNARINNVGTAKE